MKVLIFFCLCGFVVSTERRERMLNAKDNAVLGFIFDYLTSLGTKVDKLKDKFHEFDKTQSPIRDELAVLKKNGDLRQNDIDILKKQQESVADHIKKRAIAFHARLSNDVVLKPGQTVVFDDAITNIGNAYNPHTGHFTAPYDGAYFFTSSFLKRYSSDLHLSMLKNSRIISRGHATNSASGSVAGSMNAAIYLKKGDVVKIAGYKVTARIHGDWSFFTGHIITDKI